jgi:hypothetical protein
MNNYGFTSSNFLTTIVLLSWSIFVVLCGLLDFEFAIGPKIRRLKPGRGQWISKSNKNPEQKFPQKGSKGVASMPQDFTSC